MGSHGGEMGAIASLTVITTLHWTSVSFGSMSVVEPCEVDFLSMASNHICVAALRFNKTVIFIYVIEVSFFFVLSFFHISCSTFQVKKNQSVTILCIKDRISIYNVSIY